MFICISFINQISSIDVFLFQFSNSLVIWFLYLSFSLYIILDFRFTVDKILGVLWKTYFVFLNNDLFLESGLYYFKQKIVQR